MSSIDAHSGSCLARTDRVTFEAVGRVRRIVPCLRVSKRSNLRALYSEIFSGLGRLAEIASLREYQEFSRFISC